MKLGDFCLPDLQSKLSCLGDSNYCIFTINQHIPIPEPDYKIANIIEEYSFDRLEKVLNEYRNKQGIPDEDIIIAIINKSLERNYFSFAYYTIRSAVITIKDLEKLLDNDVQIKEFLISEIAEHAVAIIEEHSWHEEPRRCLFDFCGDKRDIIPSMSSRTLCESCDSRLSQKAKELLQRSFDCIKKFDLMTSLSQEIKKMTEEPKRIIHTQSYFEKGTHTHTHNYAPEQNLPEAVDQIQQLLVKLQQNYPGDIERAVHEEIKRNPTFRDRLRNAFKEGGLETLKQLFEPLNIPIEFVRGWVEAEAQPIKDDRA